MDITMKLKKINDNQYDKHLNYDINKLRLKPEETQINEGIKIEKLIEELRNNKQIISWENMNTENLIRIYGIKQKFDGGTSK